MVERLAKLMFMLAVSAAAIAFAFGPANAVKTVVIDDAPVVALSR